MDTFSRYFLKRIILLIVLSFCITSLHCSLSFATGIQYDENNEPYAVNLSQGSFIKGVLLHKISTNSNNIGDSVELIVGSGLQYGNTTCIPINSIISGKIVRMEKAKPGLNGYIQIIFDTITFPDNTKYNIVGHVWTKKGDGTVGGEFTPRIKYRKMPHESIELGKTIQLVPDGPRIMGKETEILPGQEWLVVLDKELIIEVNEDE